MKSYSTFSGWDWTNTWDINGVTNDGYPFLSTTGSGFGDGSTNDPYLILTCLDLQDMENSLTSHYQLNNNIDCSDTITWNSGDGFDPIGDTGTPFIGSLDGNNYNISELFIDLSGVQRVGLFKVLQGNLTNIGFVNANVTGNHDVGIAVGDLYTGGIIDNAYSTGFVTGTGSAVGGLVGTSNYGFIYNSSARVTVSGVGNVGGLIGTSQSKIHNSSATGNVSGTGDGVGGLVGWQYLGYKRRN